MLKMTKKNLDGLEFSREQVNLQPYIRETAKIISEKSTHVLISKKDLFTFAFTFAKNIDSKVNNWFSIVPFDFSDLNDKEIISFNFIFNAISFSYWGDPKWKIIYRNKKFDGTLALIASFRKELSRRKDILYPEFLSSITENKLEEILSGESKIPLLKERVKNLRELGENIITNYKGNFENILEEANWDAPTLVKLVSKSFNSFSDESSYMGQKIYFFKRAQLLAADINNQLILLGKTGLSNIKELTACADYKIPQLLRDKCLIQYSKTLSELVDNQLEIPSGSQFEIEIRANTIHAIELIKNYLVDIGTPVTSMNINDHFWTLSQKKKESIKPYHRTRTSAY